MATITPILRAYKRRDGRLVRRVALVCIRCQRPITTVSSNGGVVTDSCGCRKA